MMENMTNQSFQSPNTETPYSQDAEESVIGSVLLNPAQFVTLSAFLTEDDFFFLRHQYIWRAFFKLSERRDVIDFVTVSSELQGMGVLEEIGGRPFLIQVANNTPTSVYAEFYGHVVERASIRRRLLMAADDIKGMAFDQELDIEDVLEGAENKLFELSEKRTRREFVPLVDALQAYYEEMERKLQNTSESAGITTGFRDLDKLLGGWQKSDLLVFAGRPGMGKTSFLLTTAMNAAWVGKRGAIFNMEMGVGQMVQRMIAMETGIDVQKLRRANLSPQETSRFAEAIGRISHFPIFIDDTPALTPNEVRAKCRRLRHEHGLDMIMIDYMQLMNAGRAYSNNRVQEISYISRALKELARELSVPLISAAQLSRAVEQRNDKRPLLSDLRESGSIEQDADIVMFLYRDDVYNPATEFPNQAEVIVAKHRNGPAGVVSLYFEKAQTKFVDASIHHLDLSEAI
ncbi:replicative DNA helicase [Anaerolineales bacterium]